MACTGLNIPKDDSVSEERTYGRGGVAVIRRSEQFRAGTSVS